jgi:hypothetical protein
MAGRTKWTEEKIESLRKEGRGLGRGPDYRPWIEVQDFSSQGRCLRRPSQKTGRSVHHFMSDIESRLFAALEWQRDVIDIREQFPLFDRSFTQQVARELKVAHPYYPGTHVPVVMTVDFMVTRVVDGKEVQEAFDAKDAGALNDLNTLNKLEITREALCLMEVRHHLVLDTSIPRTRIDNIEWIQSASVRQNEKLPRENYFEELKANMEGSLRSYRGNLTLGEYCRQFEDGLGLPRGTGLRVAKLLMLDRTLVPDLSLRNIEKSLVKEMTLTASFGNLRAVA